jgi:hypothetical protein
MNTLEEENARDMSVPMGRVQILVLPFVFASLLLMIPYTMIWGLGAFAASWTGFFSTLWCIPILFGGILMHELIHAITWKYLAGLRWSEMQLGFQWKTLTPYAHAKKPMKMNPYRWGALMPALVLGFLPYLITLFTGSGGLFVFGVMFVTAAGGDFWILYVLRKESGENWVADHPENAGCIVYES